MPTNLWNRAIANRFVLPGVFIVVVAFVVAVGLATAPQLPAPECDQNFASVHAALPCNTAVRLAMAALPTDHARITRVQFGYGSARPFDCGGLPVSIPPRVCGYVVFTFSDQSRAYVALERTDDRLLVASPRPF